MTKWLANRDMAERIKRGKEIESIQKLLKKNNNNHKRKNNHKWKKIIRKRYDSIVLIGLMMASALMSGFFFGYAYGENYVFNMTQELEEEGRLLPLCMVDAKIKIDGLDEFCTTRYGGINTSYGEPIK